MKVKLWGTRGSIPTPSTQQFQTAQFGGDTTCVSVESGDLLVILDGGSGLRLLGLDLQKKPAKGLHASFFFSHVHWDHIQGFPFFLPGFDPGNRFELFGPPLIREPGFVGNILEKALRGQQENLNFPVQLKEMPATMIFEDVQEGQEVIRQGKDSELVITGVPLNHPGGCFGYRVEEWKEGKHASTFSFVTDTEHLEDINPQVQILLKDADLVLHDAQYTPEEYEGMGGVSRKGWGHSTWESALRECRAGNARQLLLHHHDPMHDDAAISAIEEAAQAVAAKTSVGVQAAQQYREFEL